MCQQVNANHAGFSMVELLVTLVMLGLISSFVAPGVGTWLSSRETAALRMEVNSKVALLPLKASRSGLSIVISDAKQLDLAQYQLVFTQPIWILANGFCKGGEFTHIHNEREFHYQVIAPYCEVIRSDKV